MGEWDFRRRTKGEGGSLCFPPKSLSDEPPFFAVFVVALAYYFFGNRERRWIQI